MQVKVVSAKGNKTEMKTFSNPRLKWKAEPYGVMQRLTAGTRNSELQSTPTGKIANESLLRKFLPVEVLDQWVHQNEG